MLTRNKIFALVFTMFVVAVGFVISAEAQIRRGVTVSRTTSRPVVVRRIYRDPFWRARYYDPFYDPFYYSPYLRYKDQETLLRQELAGNRREYEKHLSKYRADGVLTDKERRELEDDQRDIMNAQRRLRQYNGNYSVNY